MSKFLFAGVVAAALSAVAPAFAQQAAAPAPAAAASPLGGAQVPGVCLLSQQVVLANAKVGQAATLRLRELAQNIQSELAVERKPIEADSKTLQTQASGLKAPELDARRQALAGKVQTLQADAQEKTRQLELTREKALARIATEAQPVIAQVYKAHGCGLLLDRNSVLGGNMSNDLTAAVIQGLDAKMTTITFDLEPMPAPAKTASR